jgi:hypothetical protein
MASSAPPSQRLTKLKKSAFFSFSLHHRRRRTSQMKKKRVPVPYKNFIKIFTKWSNFPQNSPFANLIYDINVHVKTQEDIAKIPQPQTYRKSFSDVRLENTYRHNCKGGIACDDKR